jgi:hypothetical protein
MSLLGRNRMTVEDWRGLTPLIYHHVNPYGRIELVGRPAVAIGNAMEKAIMSPKAVF